MLVLGTHYKGNILETKYNKLVFCRKVVDYKLFNTKLNN